MSEQQASYGQHSEEQLRADAEKLNDLLASAGLQRIEGHSPQVEALHDAIAELVAKRQENQRLKEALSLLKVEIAWLKAHQATGETVDEQVQTLAEEATE